MAKTKILVLEHKDSFVRQEVSEEEYETWQQRIKDKYKLKSTKEVETPAELEKKK